MHILGISLFVYFIVKTYLCKRIEIEILNHLYLLTLKNY